MPIRKIYIWPDPVLKQKAKPITIFDENLKILAEDMFTTMYAANGVGLAGNQIGQLDRILVIDLDPNNEGSKDQQLQNELNDWGFDGPKVFINPQIIAHEGQILWNEGCLSVPGITEEVKRFEKITVKAQNVDGETFEVNAEGLYSVAIQHEMDHLDGRVFVEYLSSVKRDSVKRAMKRLKVKDIDDGVVAAQALQ